MLGRGHILADGLLARVRRMRHSRSACLCGGASCPAKPRRIPAGNSGLAPFRMVDLADTSSEARLGGGSVLVAAGAPSPSDSCQAMVTQEYAIHVPPSHPGKCAGHLESRRTWMGPCMRLFPEVAVRLPVSVVMPRDGASWHQQSESLRLPATCAYCNYRPYSF